MPYTGDRETLRNEGIVQSFISAANLPPNATVEQLTQLFDAAGTVSKIKFLDGLVDTQTYQSATKIAIIGYYSDETARNAVQDLSDNMALGLDYPLSLEYFGPISVDEVESEIKRRMAMSILRNGLNGIE